MNSGVDFGTNIEDAVMPAGTHEMNVPVTAPPKQTAKVDRLGPYKRRIWIILEDNDNIPPTGQFFGHNGVGFMLRAGFPVEVPAEIVDILNNAVYLAPSVDPQTHQIIGYRERLRFPYRMVPKPADAEQAA